MNQKRALSVCLRAWAIAAGYSPELDLMFVQNLHSYSCRATQFTFGLVRTLLSCHAKPLKHTPLFLTELLLSSRASRRETRFRAWFGLGCRGETRHFFAEPRTVWGGEIKQGARIVIRAQNGRILEVFRHSLCLVRGPRMESKPVFALEL